MKKFFVSLLCTIMMITFMPAMTWAETAAGLPEGMHTGEERNTLGYDGNPLPASPEMQGNTIIVNPENAQYTLDGAYGSIDGKTIHFSMGEYNDVLDLSRMTKFSGSNTKYYNGKWTQSTGWQKIDGSGEYGDLTDETPIKFYERAIQNVTFTADEGVVLPGFTASSGHNYQNTFDYVRLVDVPNSNNSFYANCNISGMVFSGLTIKGTVRFNLYCTAEVKNLTFENCSFVGDAEKMSQSEFKGIDLKTDTESFDNVTVSNCRFASYYQGFFVQNPNGVRVNNCEFDRTTHNAIAIQSSKDTVKGSVVLEENLIKNAADRAIRFGEVDSSAKIDVNNNIMLDSGDDEGELIKTQSEEVTADLENNYWNGKNAYEAVNWGDTVPRNTGIKNGTFNTELQKEWLASDADAYERKDGTYAVAEKKPDGTPSLEPEQGYHWEKDDKGNFVEVKDEMPPAPPVITTYYDVTVGQAEHGMITVDKNRVPRYGEVNIAIVPESGYEIRDVMINGKSIGAVEKYTIQNVQQDYHITADFVETESTINNRLIAGVKNTTIKMYYKKDEIGKGWIKLRYKKSYGYKVDNYEIFRSAKKKTNFGDEAWFVTKTNKIKGYYKNGKSVKKGTRYYYKMRGVREIAGEKVYTQWSNVVMRTGR